MDTRIAAVPLTEVLAADFKSKNANMTVHDREILLLHRDAASNSILASHLPRSISNSSNDFPTAFILQGKRFIAQLPHGPFQVTFWNHLLRSNGRLQLISGFEFYFVKGNDDVVLNSMFCQSAPTNLGIISKNADGSLEVQIQLTSDTSDLASDCCQAFGSLYYSDGEDIAIAILSWHPINEYEFPVLTHSVFAIEW